MTRQLIVRGLPLAALLIGIASARASALSGPIGGQVRDRAGQPVAGATVSVVELKRGATTDSVGRFQLGEVPAGRYTVSARRLGFAAAVQSITVDSSPLDISFTLDVAPARVETVNVTATRAPIADSDSTLPTYEQSSEQVH